MADLNFIVRLLGGSHLYGLNTPQSDNDYRGVYLNNTVSEIIGLERHYSFVTKSPEGALIDEAYFELRHFLKLLKSTNSGAVELLFEEAHALWNPIWYTIQKEKHKLIDSEYFYKSLKSYMLNETRLAIGERTGKLGGKRKAMIDQYGYSCKNVVQLFRLCYAGEQFFKTGIFPVNIKEHNSAYADWLIDIKLHPEKYKITELLPLIKKAEEQLDSSYNSTKINFKFDDNIANEIILKAYLPILKANEN